MVDEGALDVRGPIRGVCAAILSVITFRVYCDASCEWCFWREKL